MGVQMDRAFIDDMGYLWLYRVHMGFLRFEGMSDPKIDGMQLHPKFLPFDLLQAGAAFEEITKERALDIIDEYWTEQAEALLRRDL